MNEMQSTLQSHTTINVADMHITALACHPPITTVVGIELGHTTKLLNSGNMFCVHV